MQINLGPLSFMPGFSCSFPNNLCVNCGSASGLSPQVMQARVATFLLIGGAELRIPLPTVACAKCAETLKRRPLTKGNQIFISLLVIAAVATVLFMKASMAPKLDPYVGRHIFLESLLLGGALCGAWLGFLRRPKPPQTS